MLRKYGAAIAALVAFPLVTNMAVASVFPAGTNGPGLTAVGPVSATDGFPVWYKDKTGLRLENCIAAADPLCPARGPLPDESAPISFPDNYPDEGFYSLTSANLDTAPAVPGLPGKALLAVALEQAFRSGPVIDGDQVTFARLRVKITNAQDGVDYKFTTPVGVKTVQTSRPNLVFDTEDIGVGGPGDFSGALGGRIGPFLTWDTFPTDPALKPVAAKDTYIGDGATLHKITGSPYNSNIFRIEGPGINPTPAVDACPTVAGPLGDCVETDLFTVQGKLATTSGVTADQVTYSRSAAGGGMIDVYASSAPDSSQSIQVSDPVTHELATTGLAGSLGHYFARVPWTGADPPAQVQVQNVGDVPVTTKQANVVDRVTGQATYDTDAQTLTVTAASSDTAVPRALTVLGYGALTAGQLIAGPVDAPPATVTVTSDAKGSLVLPVLITGTARAPISVMAQAGPDQQVSAGALVTLDGSASSGDVGTYSWVSPVGITLSDPNSATPTFTAAAAGTYTFTLTVTGPGGPASASVNVTVTPAVSAVANAGPAQTVQRGSLVTLDGTGSTGAATYKWTQAVGPGDKVVGLTGATTARPTFTFPFYKYPASNGPLTFSLHVTSGDGSASDATVKITPTSDVLVVSLARYVPTKGTWRIDGSSSILAGQRVTGHLGGLDGPVLGSALVDPLGVIAIRSTPGIAAVAGQTVSVESQLGGTLLGTPVRIG